MPSATVYLWHHRSIDKTHNIPKAVNVSSVQKVFLNSKSARRFLKFRVSSKFCVVDFPQITITSTDKLLSLKHLQLPGAIHWFGPNWWCSLPAGNACYSVRPLDNFGPSSHASSCQSFGRAFPLTLGQGLKEASRQPSWSKLEEGILFGIVKYFRKFRLSKKNIIPRSYQPLANST